MDQAELELSGQPVPLDLVEDFDRFKGLIRSKRVQPVVVT